MKSVNIYEAKTHLSALILEVGDGEEVVIAKAGQPVARLVPFREERAMRKLGCDVGLPFFIADDFDAFVPEEFEEYTG